MDLTIVDELSPSCDEFARLQPEAELCHLTGWSNMVQERFGHRCYYLVAREDQQIKGILPVAFIRSRIFGSRMVSQPFSDYGGPLVTSETARQMLCQAAVELSKRHHCHYIEFRNTKPMPYDLILRTDKACMYLPLCADPQVVWTRLRPQIRNRIRKAMSSHIAIKQAGMELLEDFYRIWTIRMSQLGTPCYHRRLFEGILDTFANEATIFLADLEGEVIGGLFAYEFNGCAHTRWGAVLRQYDPISPNYLLNWTAIEFYCHKGADRLDFGRSTVNSSQYEFKRRWGAEPVGLNWQYWVPQGGWLKILTPDSDGFKWKVQVWKRLPVVVTRTIGPWISTSLV